MSSLPGELKGVFARYVAGPSRVRQALAGSDRTRLNRPGAGSWSARDIVIHLADVEVAEGYAIRTLVATEADPRSAGVDPDLWRRRLGYLWRDIELALALFELLRFANAEIVQHADLSALRRLGMRGGRAITAAEFLAAGADHVDEHVAELTKLLSR